MDIPDFSLTFEGYWRDKKKRGIPAESGIYCVYTCIYSGKKQTCSPQKLVYVGAAEDVRDCLDHHARQEDWESHIDTGEELCYSFAPVAAEHREGYAAALVRKHKPPENTESGSILPDNGTVFVLSGATAFLSKRFSAG
jgi:hypothetical protein